MICSRGFSLCVKDGKGWHDSGRSQPRLGWSPSISWDETPAQPDGARYRTRY